MQHKLMFMQWGQLAGGLTEEPRRYTADNRESETWHAPVVRPAVPASGAPVPTRTGDNLDLRVPEFVDAEGHHGAAGGARSRTPSWRGSAATGSRSPTSRTAGRRWRRPPGGPLPPGRDHPAVLGRVALRHPDRHGLGVHLGSTGGRRRHPLSLLQVDYRVPADLVGTVRGNRPHQLGLTVRQPTGCPGRPAPAFGCRSPSTGRHLAQRADHGSGTRYTATVPAGRGTVSLRVRAADRAGNTVDQTVLQAYGLR
ncbi:hypothetical protein NKG94_17750 [Micromonospora sp. M12]